MKDKRAFILIFDMLAGHWAEGAVVPSTGLCPPNVIGYAGAGRLPNFSECIGQGVFAYSWNRGACNTAHGQKYLASGTYRVKTEPSHTPYCRMTEGMDRINILYACKKQYPAGRVASFGSDAWMQSGWWKAPDATFGWGSYYSDFMTAQHCFKWMMENPGWKMGLLYLAQYDMTGNCPVYAPGAAYTEDKHHSLLHLDRLLWMVREFLKENRWWEDTFLFIGSDHGCHYGCEVSVAEGREKGIPEPELANYCGNHQEPYDCRGWDFKEDKPSDTENDCPRRTTFIVSGGALGADYRGVTVPRADIIDFSPTVAGLMEIDFQSDGASII